MRIISTLPPWLTEQKIFCGWDGEGENEGNNDDGAGDGDGDGGEGGDESPPKKDSYTEDDVTGLKSALDKERRERKARDKELKELRKLKKEKEDADLAKKGDAEREKTRADKAEEKLSKLAPAFKRDKVERAILAEAGRQHFIDPSDALTLYSEIADEVEQDEDDPSQVTIDEKMIARKVKELASRKKHLVGSGTPDGQKTGSSFNSRTDGGGTTKDEEERLRQQYRI